MPRFNNDGRSQKFVHMGGGGGGRKYNGQDQEDRNPFKFTLQKSRLIQRKPKTSAFSRLDDAGDVVMDPTQPGSSRDRRNQDGQFQGHKGKGGKQWRKLNNQNKPRDNNSFGPGWHKITILNGAAYDRTYIMDRIVTETPVTFQPIAYTPLGANTCFYVEDRTVAEALAGTSGRITAPNSPTMEKVILRVSNCGTPPTATFDETCEAKFKAELGRRFNSNIQTLSLNDFSSSPQLFGDYFLPLFRPSVVNKLSELIQPLLPTLVGLDLSFNKLSTLDGLHRILTKATALKALNLRGNKIRQFGQFDRLQGLGIIELILEGNPVCDQASDKDTYISAVRKRFPKVVKLDGVDLPAPISFEVSEPSKLPEVRGSSYCNEKAKEVILSFWKLYVTIFDADDRQPLLDAYHDTASMSMMAAYPGGHVSQIEPWKKLSVYLADSRNMIRQTDKSKRFRLLRQGKVDIVSFLNKLPKTSHDHNSYIIDMPVAVENFILFSVTGIFKERDERHQPLRYFSRTFTLVPQNSGFVIINEMLSITNPTNDQVKTAFKLPAPTPSPSPVPHVQAGVPQMPIPTTDEERRQVLALFVQQSGMNEDWGRRCLEENAWDFNKSAFIFTQLKEQNKIPPEAFVK